MLIADSTLLNCPYLNPNDCLPCFADGVIEDLAEGVRYMMSTPIAFGMVGLGFAFGSFGSSYLQVLPAFGKEVLNMNAAGAGFLLTVADVGSLVGNLFLASFGNPQYKNWRRLGMIILFGGVPVAFAISSVYILSHVLLFFTGVGFTRFFSMGTTVLQLTTSSQLRGRMMSLWLIGAAMHYIGALPLGAVGEYWGWPMSLGGTALAIMAFGLWVGHSQTDAACAEGLEVPVCLSMKLDDVSVG